MNCDSASTKFNLNTSRPIRDIPCVHVNVMCDTKEFTETQILRTHGFWSMTPYRLINY